MTFFQKFFNSYSTRSWAFHSFLFHSFLFRSFLFHSFLLLYVTPGSAAQGDPTRIPNSRQKTGLIYESKFKRWPSCATDCGLQPALNSSREEWCTVTLMGGCMETDFFIRTTKFCSFLESAPCSPDKCVIPPGPQDLLSWANTVCNLTTNAQTLWKNLTSKREEMFQRLTPLDSPDSGPPCATKCQSLSKLISSSSISEPCFDSDKPGNECVKSKSFLNNTAFCPALVDECPEACTTGNDPRQLFGWVNKTCAHESFSREKWKNVTMVKEEAWVSEWIPTLFPWNWTVQSLNQRPTLATFGIQISDPITSSNPYLSVPASGPGTCVTSTKEKLGVFAVVNAISLLLLPILGRRTVVHKLTCGIGGTLGSSLWPVMGMLSALLNLCANLANAALIRSTPGFEGTPVIALALLWCTRPRLSWLAVFLAAFQAKEGMYFGCAASAITSETILQILGAIYFGITANYGREKGFYLIKHLDPYPRGVAVHVMYAGALLWLIMSLFTFIGCLTCMMGLNEVIANARRMMEGIDHARGNAMRGSLFERWAPKWLQDYILKRKKPVEDSKPPRKLTAAEIRRIQAVINAWIIFGAFVAQWLFWAGFISASKERYCPPKLITLGTIWGAFSGLGIFMGSVH